MEEVCLNSQPVFDDCDMYMVIVPLWTKMNLWKHSQRRIFHGQLWVRNMILLMRHTTFIMLMLRYWALAAELAIHGFDPREKSDIELNLSFAGMISIHAYERKYYKEAVADLESRNLSVELKRRCSF